MVRTAVSYLLPVDSILRLDIFPESFAIVNVRLVAF